MMIRFWQPFRLLEIFPTESGGVASLNPRLPSGNPSGWQNQSSDFLIICERHNLEQIENEILFLRRQRVVAQL